MQRAKLEAVGGQEEARGARWEGGFTRREASGELVFYIRKQLAGKRYEVPTPVRLPPGASPAEYRAAESLAEAEFRAFKANPAAYGLREETRADEPLYLSPELRQRFIAWSERPRAEGGKGNSPRWRKRQDNLLQWWAAQLADGRGRALDLRHLSRSRHIMPALDGTGDARHKRIAIKTFFHWMWSVEDLITSAQDPVFDLPVGKGNRAQVEGGINKVVPRTHVLAVIDHLLDAGSIYGHVLTLQADTGWHDTELDRFASSGTIVLGVPEYLAQSGVVGSVSVIQKNGKPTSKKINARAMASARVLLNRDAETGQSEALAHRRAGFYRGTGERRGGISISNYKRRVHAACDALGIPRFNPAWMRHTNATLAKEIGHKVEVIGASNSHAPGSTMIDEFYAPNAIVPKLRTVLDDSAPGPVAAAQEAPPARRRRPRAR